MAHAEGKNTLSIPDLVRTRLRMRPDRIIVGEVRDAAAADRLNAMLTGHEGSLSTGHANSVKDMLLRLESMVMSAGEALPLSAVRQRIASALDVVVHLGRLRDRTRRVMEITEVVGYEGDEIVLNPIFHFDSDGGGDGEIQGRLVRVNQLVQLGKLRLSGNYERYMSGFEIREEAAGCREA